MSDSALTQLEIFQDNSGLHYAGTTVRRLLARRLFLHFCQYVYAGFMSPPHVVRIAKNLDDINCGRSFRSMYALPPRHTKSLLCSELFPAFWLGCHPEGQIIHASYAAALSNSFSMKVRGLIRDSYLYKELFPHVVLDPGRQRLDDWKLSSGGGFKSIGVTGGITGHGADLFIIDDPHKEGDEQSGRALQAVFDWYNSAARTRLSPGAAVVFPMTRWHPRDLAGRLLDIAEHDPQADQWDVFSFPALALKNDPLGRKVGEPLWPDRFSKVDLHAIRAISERYFEALFQQNPSVTDKPLFVLDNFSRTVDACDWLGKPFWAVDLAITEKTRSDYTVIGQWSYDGRRTLKLHKVMRFRAQWPTVKRRLVEILREYGQPMYFPKDVLELVAVQSLREAYPTLRHLVKDVSMPGDKVAKAQPLSDFCQNGIVVIPFGQEFDFFIREHCGFPDEVRHDDCVDMSSVATHALGFRDRFSITVARIGKKYVDKNTS
jgi:phage terminase large subunit-like protein